MCIRRRWAQIKAQTRWKSMVVHFYVARRSGGEVLWWARLCVCVCVCVCLSVCLSASISPKLHARSLPIFLCKLPMAVRCKKDKSIANTVMVAKWIIHARQAQIRIRKILSTGDASYRPGRVWWECTAGVKSDICDCLVFCVDGEVQIWCKMLERTFYTNRSDAALWKVLHLSSTGLW